LPNAATARVRILDAATMQDAAEHPEEFRAAGTTAAVERGTLRLSLGPYAVARVDVAAAT
jgi:hypothetical protein